MRKSVVLLALAVFLTLVVAGCGSPAPVTLINYPMTSGGGDLVDRGFYITAYPGTTLDQVTLYFSASDTSTYNIQLQALDSAYNGTVIGTATSSFSGSTNTSDNKTTVFNFSNAAVTKGNVVAFKMSIASGSGSGSVYFSPYGNYGGATPIVQETVGTTPPLDSPNRAPGMAIIVTGRQ